MSSSVASMRLSPSPGDRATLRNGNSVYVKSFDGAEVEFLGDSGKVLKWSIEDWSRMMVQMMPAKWKGGEC